MNDGGVGLEKFRGVFKFHLTIFFFFQTSDAGGAEK